MEETPINNGRHVKCPQCIFRQTDNQMCYHRMQSRLHQCTAMSRGDDCYVKQPKYNIVTRYRAIDGRYNFHSRTNRSLSSIVDAFRANSEPAADDAFFGERIFTINYNRPNAGQTHVANSDIKRFTHFAAKSAVGESVQQQSGNGGEGGEPMSRFTVTTLSRDASMRTMDKNLTLPRNGGVFVAVRDWSTASTPTPTAQADTENDNYYEILKNPNNNAAQPTYENSSQPLKVDADDANGVPIYAVVNKANKMKNRQPTGADATKFTYIGMSPSTANAKMSDSFYATIRRSSPNNSSIANAINNNGSVVAAANNNGNNKRFSCSDVDAKDSTTHVSITSSTDKPHSETSQIYAKVWKGPKKPMDSQKMYALIPFSVFH